MIHIHFNLFNQIGQGDIIPVKINDYIVDAV